MIALEVFWSPTAISLGDGGAYMTQGWNLLDFFIVSISVVDWILSSLGSSKQLKALKALRAFRALRPLRMINRNEGLKLLVTALLHAIPAIGNLLMVVGLLMFIFAIIGINTFSGR